MMHAGRAGRRVGVFNRVPTLCNQLLQHVLADILHILHRCNGHIGDVHNNQPPGHVITGDVNIARNEELKLLILKGPKFREPRSCKWQQNFISIMDSVEDYASRWAKSEKEELDSLSEWVKCTCIRGILKSRIKHVR
jgi:hypothetical protein